MLTALYVVAAILAIIVIFAVIHKGGPVMNTILNQVISLGIFTWIFFMILVGVREGTGKRFYLGLCIAVLIAFGFFLFRSNKSDEVKKEEKKEATTAAEEPRTLGVPRKVAFVFIILMITLGRLENITPAGVWEKYSSSPKHPRCGDYYVVTATPKGSPEIIKPPRCYMRYIAEDTMKVYMVMTPFDTVTEGPNHYNRFKSLPKVSFRSFQDTVKIGIELIPM